MRLEGTVTLARALASDPDWLSEPFRRGQCWIDLLLLANLDPAAITKNGEVIEVDRGQLLWSIKGLADRWQWSQTKAKAYLLRQQKIGRLTIDVNQRRTLITIVNYDEYNPESRTDQELIKNSPRTDQDRVGSRDKGVGSREFPLPTDRWTSAGPEREDVLQFASDWTEDIATGVQGPISAATAIRFYTHYADDGLAFPRNWQSRLASWWIQDAIKNRGQKNGAARVNGKPTYDPDPTRRDGTHLPAHLDKPFVFPDLTHGRT